MRVIFNASGHFHTNKPPRGGAIVPAGPASDAQSSRYAPYVVKPPLDRTRMANVLEIVTTCTVSLLQTILLLEINAKLAFYQKKRCFFTLRKYISALNLLRTCVWRVTTSAKETEEQNSFGSNVRIESFVRFLTAAAFARPRVFLCRVAIRFIFTDRNRDRNDDQRLTNNTHTQIRLSVICFFLNFWVKKYERKRANTTRVY